ncbi:MAG: type II secretion system protein M [Desulfobacteraceae bacterium]|nr:type II secretion system protein M [Desulfobacteraceae bacterium]MCF8094218.1 type II secretion system protein M [Desulfobacteraceae bacterium]
MIREILRMVPLNISSREKLFLGAGAGFVLLFLIFLLLIQPVFQKRTQLAGKLAAKQQSLSEIKQMYREYQSLQSRTQKAEKRYSERPEGFTLFSFMDRLAGETGIKENITYMKPGSTEDESRGLKISHVELKLQDVTIEELISYLFHIETSKSMVRINRLSISREGEGKSLLSVVMQAETFET